MTPHLSVFALAANSQTVVDPLGRAAAANRPLTPADIPSPSIFANWQSANESLILTEGAQKLKFHDGFVQ